VPVATNGGVRGPDGYARSRGQTASMEEELDMILF